MKAKYEEPLSAADLALAQLRANNQAGQKTLNNLTDDLANSALEALEPFRMLETTAEASKRPNREKPKSAV